MLDFDMRRDLRLLIAELEGFSQTALRQLRETLEVETADLDRAGLLQRVDGFDALWVRLRNRIDREVFDAAPRLRFVITNTTGLNHIDLEEAERRGVRVISLRGEADFLKEVRATAELTVGLLLALVRHLPAAHAHVCDGGWNRDLFRGNELYGKTAGIVGYGRLGRIVARYLQAFDMRVLACGPHLKQSEVEPGVEVVDLGTLLSQSDVVSLHASLTSENRGFFGSEQFAAMRARSWFINTARGELVDETARLDGLTSGHLAGAALDVLCDERSGGMGNNPLVEYARGHDNLILAPHVGGNTAESLEKTESFLTAKLIQRASELKTESLRSQ